MPLAIAIGAMLAVNWSTSGQLKLARNSNVFLLAKWIDEGPALSYLENNCPEAGHALCEYVDELKGLTHDDLKWGGNSPFHKLGGFDALEPEAAAIVRQTFLAHPLEIFWRAILDTGRQMTRFGAGDGLSSSYAKLVAPHLKELYDPPSKEPYSVQNKQTGIFHSRISFIASHRACRQFSVLRDVVLRLAARAAEQVGYAVSVRSDRNV